jgi:hypothetical protein
MQAWLPRMDALPMRRPISAVRSQHHQGRYEQVQHQAGASNQVPQEHAQLPLVSDWRETVPTFSYLAMLNSITQPEQQTVKNVGAALLYLLHHHLLPSSENAVFVREMTASSCSMLGDSSNLESSGSAPYLDKYAAILYELDLGK